MSVKSQNKKQIVTFIFLTLLVVTARAKVKQDDNAWQLIQEVGEQADAIEHKVRSFSAAACCCDVEIKQSNIPFTITAPGVYCLADNVTLAEDETGVTIESECVVLDLKDHEIDGADQNNTRGVFVDGSNIGARPANVVVKNGGIKRTGEDGIFVENTTGPVKLSNLNVTESGFSRGGIQINGSKGVFVHDCECSENRTGFSVDTSNQCVFRDCFVRKNASAGFDMFKNSECCFLGCKAFDKEGGTGFLLSQTSSCFFHRCIVQANKNENFDIGNSNNNVFDECIAVAGDNNGFGISNSDNNIFRRCIAGGNSFDGFKIALGSHNQILNCSTVGNIGKGIDNTPIDSQIFANAANDNGTDYNGVSVIDDDPTATTKYWTNVERT